MANRHNHNNEGGRRNTPAVKMFFLFSMLCVVAFLIVALVKTCSTEHEENEAEKELIEEAYGMVVNQISLPEVTLS